MALLMEDSEPVFEYSDGLEKAYSSIENGESGYFNVFARCLGEADGSTTTAIDMLFDEESFCIDYLFELENEHLMMKKPNEDLVMHCDDQLVSVLNPENTEVAVVSTDKKISIGGRNEWVFRAVHICGEKIIIVERNDEAVAKYRITDDVLHVSCFLASIRSRFELNFLIFFLGMVKDIAFNNIDIYAPIEILIRKPAGLPETLVSIVNDTSSLSIRRSCKKLWPTGQSFITYLDLIDETGRINLVASVDKGGDEIVFYSPYAQKVFISVLKAAAHTLTVSLCDGGTLVPITERLDCSQWTT